MNVISIAWDVLECEINLTFWHECKQGESRCLGNRLPLGNLVLLVICSLRDLILLVIWSSW